MEILCPPPSPHQIHPFHWLEGPDQHGRRIVYTLRHKIQAVIKTINQVDISKPSLSEHDLSARRSPLGGMARFILGSYVGFGLYDLPYGDSLAVVSHQVLPQQSPRNLDSRLLIERPRELQCCTGPFMCMVIYKSTPAMASLKRRIAAMWADGLAKSDFIVFREM